MIKNQKAKNIKKRKLVHINIDLIAFADCYFVVDMLLATAAIDGILITNTICICQTQGSPFCALWLARIPLTWMLQGPCST